MKAAGAALFCNVEEEAMRRIGAAVLDTIFIYILYVLVTVALSLCSTPC